MSWVLIGVIDTSVVGCNHYKATKPQSAGAGEPAALQAACSCRMDGGWDASHSCGHATAEQSLLLPQTGHASCALKASSRLD